jgi:hypothetical protein
VIDLPALRDRPQQPAIFDFRRGHPGIDPLFDPDRDCDGADAPAFAFEVGQDPPPFPLLEGFDVEFSQFVPPEGAADQKRQDDVVALPFQGGSIRDGQQLLGLLTGQPIPNRVPFWLIFGMSVRLAASSDPIMPARLASPTIFRTAESRTFIVDGDRDSMPARHSINKDWERGRLAQKANRSSSALA